MMTFALNPEFLEELDRRAAEQDREKLSAFVGYVTAIDADGKRVKVERGPNEASDRPPYPVLGGSAAGAGIVVGSYVLCLATLSGSLYILGTVG